MYKMLENPQFGIKLLTEVQNILQNFSVSENFKLSLGQFGFTMQYRTCIYSAIRQGFPLSRMTKISLVKFCYNMSFTLPKQSQRSRSIL